MSDLKVKERKSAAVTLSDMEIFIFPELMYSLVLANIMSPVIWRWREDSWFDGLERMRPYRRMTRIKQYIMDHYIFNLDLDTWGLTTKEKEMARFASFIDTETLARSNALFGYEGDKYYFDIDIRRHFGLDKYEGMAIPYWKTETVEAMDGFKYRPNYETGAGECVSLAALYAAALFVIGRIPLEDIYMMATPLHSQNYVDLDDGVLTNNRRLVTKNMWFNGTALSAQARRALENERVTIVAHATGHIHTVYDEATIDKDAYFKFSGKLNNYLKAPVTTELLGNFLRHHRDLQACFQVSFQRHGVAHYVAMERIFEYEHGSSYRVTDKTRAKLVNEIDSEELMHDPIPNRIEFNEVEAFIKKSNLDISKPEDVKVLDAHFVHECLGPKGAIDKFVKFCHIIPDLPDHTTKSFDTSQETLGLDSDMTRQEIIERLEMIRGGNVVVDLSFYSYRDLSRVESGPFLQAAFERNPVTVDATVDMSLSDIFEELQGMPNESIYEGKGRLAQPDEVWNCGRGDGVEKALLLVNVFVNRATGEAWKIKISDAKAIVSVAGEEFIFETSKELAPQEWGDGTMSAEG